VCTRADGEDCSGVTVFPGCGMCIRKTFAVTGCSDTPERISHGE